MSRVIGPRVFPRELVDGFKNLVVTAGNLTGSVGSAERRKATAALKSHPLFDLVNHGAIGKKDTIVASLLDMPLRGLVFDDLIVGEMYEDNLGTDTNTFKEAMRKMPREYVEARQKRLFRFEDLYYKKTVLPEDQRMSLVDACEPGLLAKAMMQTQLEFEDDANYGYK